MNVIDRGVRYAQSGQPLLRVFAGPQRGQYTFDPKTGVYTFGRLDWRWERRGKRVWRRTQPPTLLFDYQYSQGEPME